MLDEKMNKLHWIVDGILLAGVVALFIVADLRARIISNWRFTMRLYMFKALGDKSWRLWIPTRKAAETFNIKDVPILPDPQDYVGKAAPKHPAQLTPARRAKL